MFHIRCLPNRRNKNGETGAPGRCELVFGVKVTLQRHSLFQVSLVIYIQLIRT